MGPSHHVSQETLIGVGQNRTLKLVKIVSEYFTAGFDKLYVRNETRQGQICPPPRIYMDCRRIGSNKNGALRGENYIR